MSQKGYVALWRQSIDSRVFKNAELWKLWTWCLMKATYKERWVEMRTGRSKIEVHLQPGQFVFGRKSAAKELGVPESSIRNRMKKLKNMRNVDIKEDRQYSIVSIVNWVSYQDEINKKDIKEDRQRTGKGQAKDTNKKGNKGNKKETTPEKGKSNGKIQVAEFVKMLPKEIETLNTKYGRDRTARMIEVLDNYVGSNPKKRKYESHYRAILSWVVPKVLEEIPLGKEANGWNI
jgi:hypothetical protein